LEQRAKSLQDRRTENQESPKHGEVGDARNTPLEQLALAQHLGGNRLRARAEVTLAVGLDGLAGHREPVERKRAPTSQREGRHRDRETDDKSPDHFASI